MSKSKASEIFKSIPEATNKKQAPKLAGQDASEKAIKNSKTRKKRTVAVRLSEEDIAITEALALQLKKHGLQYSEGNALRLALRTFNASEKQIAQIAKDIKAEDRRGGSKY